MAISPKLLNDGEHVVVSTRTHPKALFVPLVVLIVLLAIGSVAQVKIDQTLAWIVWVLVLAGLVWWVLRPLLVWLTASYTITNRRLITRRGVVTRRGHDIPLTRISDVEYERGLLDRMLGCGTLMISDASTDGEVRLPDIPHVEATQRTLNELLTGVHTGGASSDDGA